jgi:hypothetical protein
MSQVSGEIRTHSHSIVPGGRGSSLNFKVFPEFKKQFTGYAVRRGITMVDLLEEGFALSKERRSQ